MKKTTSVRKATKKVSFASPTKNALLTAMQSKDTFTLNGAVSHSTTGTAVLDLFSRAAALRNQPEDAIQTLFSSAYQEDKTLALKTLFYTGDVRGGQGERRFFRTAFNWLAKNDAKVAVKLLPLVPEYRRWDDVLESTENTPIEKDALKLVANQLKKDVKEETPSICGKWAPSSNASSPITKRLAEKVRETLGYSPRSYRKLLSGLRAKIGIVERAMASNEWSEIDFQSVPSRAALIYKNAFKKHDGARYDKYLTSVEKGEAKINAGTLYPYDLVRGLDRKSVDERRVINLQWKALPDYLEGSKENGIPVLDLSGSMTCANSGNVAPIDVATSLGVYFSERNHGAFAGYVIGFSRNARLIPVVGADLSEKVDCIRRNSEVANTDFQKVFELILRKGVEENVPQKDMPTTLWVVTDCQWDAIVDNPNETNFEAIKRKYEAAGYKLPRIVFWNVNAHGDSPVKWNESGVALVSGCSPSIFKSALSGKNTTPWETFLQTVNVERYAPIVA